MTSCGLVGNWWKFGGDFCFRLQFHLWYPTPKAIVRDRSVAQANWCWTRIVKTRVRSQPCTFRIYDVKNCTGTGFSPSTSRLPCQNHSTIAPYSFIHLPPTLYNVFLPVLQLSPVIIIAPNPHPHLHVSHARWTNGLVIYTFQNAVLSPKLDIIV